MDGTVRGTFDLNTPAKRKLRELRTEGAKTDAMMRQLGGTLDRIGGPEFERRVKSIRDDIRGIGETSATTRQTVRSEFEGMRRSVETEGRRVRFAIGEIRTELRQLGRTTAKPNIDLSGIVRANAEIAALRANLAALGAVRSTPRVAMGGGFGGGGGGAIPTTGGGSRYGGGVVDFGRRGLSPRSLLIGGGLAFARPLLGGATALLGSAGSAALGAGAVGTAGLGVGVTGMLGIVAVAKPAAAGIKEVAKAQQKYNDVVADYGRKSKEAARARRELSQAEHAAPGAIGLVRESRAFQREWMQLTRPGRRSLFGGARGFIQAGRRAAPNLAFNANRSSAAFAREGVNFGNFLAERPTQMALTQLTREFVRDLPYAERTLENIMLTFEHIAVAARPFFHDAAVWTEDWTRGWADSTQNIDHTQRKIGTLVNSFKDWRDLTGATFRLLRDIFSAGRPEGDSMVVELTHTLDRWDSWIQRNPDKVRGFFREAHRDVSSLGGALVSVAGALNTIAQILDPILYRFTQLANIMGGAGLLLPTAARIGAGMVFRRGGGGGRGSGGGGGPGPVFTGGRGGGLAGRATVRDVMEGRTASGAFLMGPATSGPEAVLARRRAAAEARALATQPSRFSRAVGGLRGAPGRLGGALGRGLMAPFIPGGLGIGNRIRAARGIEGGLVRGLGGQALRGAGGLAARGLGAAAGFALPLLGIQGLIGGLTTQGGASMRAAGALNAASFGLIGMPRSNAQIEAASFRGVPQSIEAGLNRITGSSRADTAAKQIDYLRRMTRIYGTETSEQGRKIHAALRQELEDRKGIARQLHDQRVFAGQERARQLSGRIGGTFRQFSRKEGPQAALEDTFHTMIGRFHGLGREGSKVLAANMLQWGRDMARQNPALKGTVHALADDIEARFKRMGENIRIVNGRIYEGTRTEWQNIARNLSDPIERARQKVEDGFTAIQRQAVQSLVTMGYSGGDARQIVSGLEAGGSLATASRNAIRMGASGYAGQQRMAAAKRRARGGTIGGRGLLDTVPFGDGYAAPGETWIANRHTMQDLSRATLSTYGLTAQQIIGGETRRHSAPMYALGGPQTRAQRRSSVNAGMMGGLRAGIQNVASQVLAQFPGLSITSTTGGTHAKGSYHYRGMAVDIGGPGGLMNRASDWIGRVLGAGLAEGIHNPNLSVKNGRTVSPGFWGATTWGQHANHIHLAVEGGGGARGAAGLLGGALAGVGRIRLRGTRSGLGGVPGALADRATSIFAQGLQQKVNRRLRAMGGDPELASLAGFTGGGDARANMALGRRMMLASGWDASQWPALKALWTRESGWSTTARNPASGAFGIPQALGHGDIGDTAARQIAWGLRYIRGRYGSPSGAWAHSQSTGWYARGGRVPAWGGWNARGGEYETRGPVIFGAGEKRRERVSIRPIGKGTFGRGGHTIHVDMRGAVISSEMDIDTIGEKVAKKILAAIDRAEEDDE